MSEKRELNEKERTVALAYAGHAADQLCSIAYGLDMTLFETRETKDDEHMYITLCTRMTKGDAYKLMDLISQSGLIENMPDSKSHIESSQLEFNSNRGEA